MGAPILPVEGSAQSINIAATLQPVIVVGWGGEKCAHTKASAAMTRGKKQCQRRSSKRLLLQPTPIMAMAVGTYRVLVMRASLALCHACIISHPICE